MEEKLKKKASVIVNAPVEEVFSYILKPENQPFFWPSLKHIENIKCISNGGYCFRYMFECCNQQFFGQCNEVKVVPYQSIVMELKGGIQGTISYQLTAEKKLKQTKVFVDARYHVAGPLLVSLAQSIIADQWGKELPSLLDNLKKGIEQ